MTSSPARESETIGGEPRPPPLTAGNFVYTANYCEENIYLLVQRFLDSEEIRTNWEVFAIFISNKTRTVRAYPFSVLHPLEMCGSYSVLIQVSNVVHKLTGSIMESEVARRCCCMGLSCHPRAQATFWKWVDMGV